jgi:pimeloyl-ACP methyl ester carboxylesterase
MKRVVVRGVAWNVWDEGAGETLLLVHGFPLDHSMWVGQLEAFSARYRVIAPDLRGFGGTPASDESVSMEQFADDLAGLLAALKIDEPVVFCGLSMGGYIALQFVKQHADRLKALVLCDTRAAADSAEAAANRLSMAQRVLSEGAEVAAEAMAPRLFGKQTTQQRPELVESVRRVMLSTAPTAIAAAQRGMAARSEMTDYLPQISVPTLVVVGEEDPISPVAEMRQIAESIPGAQFAIISDAGHMAPLENPAAFNAELEKFRASTTESRTATGS